MAKSSSDCKKTATHVLKKKKKKLQLSATFAKKRQLLPFGRKKKNCNFCKTQSVARQKNWKFHYTIYFCNNALIVPFK